MKNRRAKTNVAQPPPAGKNNPRHSRGRLCHIQASAPHGAFDLTGTADVNLTAAEDGSSKVKQATFAMSLYNGGPMNVGWGRPVVIDLEGLRAAEPITSLLNHDRELIVGQSTAVAITTGAAGGVQVQGIITGNIDAEGSPANIVVQHARKGFKWPCSNGTSPESVESVDAGVKVTVNGRELSGPLYIVRAGVLREGSFVSMGADETAQADIAAAAAKEQLMNIQQWAKSLGIDFDKASKEVKASLQAQFELYVAASAAKNTPPKDEDEAPAPKPAKKPGKKIQAQAGDDDAPADDAPDYDKIEAQKTRRVAAIRKACAGNHPDIEAKAIEEGWTIDKAKVAVLEASLPKAPAVHAPDQSLTTHVLEAACMLSGASGMTGGRKAVEAMYDAPTLEAAAKRFSGGLGCQEFLLEAAWANGYTGRNGRDMKAVLRFAFGHGIQAGFSTVDIGGILSNVGNKFLLDGFNSVEMTWRGICAVRNVTDFKTITSYRLIGKDQYEIVAPGGALKHGTLGEESYTNKADTYGLMLQIDRRDYINDDLGAITTVPRKLGRGSGLKINDVFWTIFLANASFFTGAANNYISGATTALSIDALTTAETTFMDQVDGDGKPLGIMPAILLLPTALGAFGTSLFKSLEIRDTTGSTKYPTNNPHANKFRPEVSRYLGNSAYTGYSASAWYLLADPADLPVIEVAFLNGQESPTIETAEADFSVLGVQMRGYHDFGVAKQDPKGGLKSKGKA